MTEQDEKILRQLCGGEISPRVQALYGRCERLLALIGGGQFARQTLILMVALSENAPAVAAPAKKRSGPAPKAAAPIPPPPPQEQGDGEEDEEDDNEEPEDAGELPPAGDRGATKSGGPVELFKLVGGEVLEFLGPDGKPDSGTFVCKRGRSKVKLQQDGNKFVLVENDKLTRVLEEANFG